MLPSNWFEISGCKGCEYGERITSGVFCTEIQGLVPIGYQGCKAQNDFYEEQYKREKGMTLAELAKKLREIFKFKYLTYDPFELVRLWYEKPEYRSGALLPSDPGMWRIPHKATKHQILAEKHGFGRAFWRQLDLSEYTDGKRIDYSKCIVEVE